MTPELTVLALAILLQAVQFALFAVYANVELGPGYAASSRDRPPPRPLSLRAGRVQRAFDNHFQALILFAPAALLVAVSGQSTWFTAACAWVYLIARIVYVPAYVFGLVPWRSMIFAVGLAATLLMTLAALV